MTVGLVDLRSDTVTRPTPQMRRAMAQAEVGDDGWGEDPTVRALEEAYAARVGKAAGLFVPSGTMANQVALRVLCPPGARVVAGMRHHVVLFEEAGAARNAGVQLHLLDDTGGMYAAGDLELAIESAAHHQPSVGLVWVEQTHMAAGGVPVTIGWLQSVATAARRVPVHMDGARLFNAEVATGTSAAEHASHATTVMTCMTKGLGAPVGAVIAGQEDVMAEARSERRRLGGSMRQAGIVAAAALVGLQTMVERLPEDHARARRLAEAVALRWPGAIDPDAVRTNIVVFAHNNTGELLAHLHSQGVLAGTIAPGACRFVTHYDVDDDGIERALRAIATAP